MTRKLRGCPELTDSFAVRHDEDVWSCMRTILGSPTAPPLARVISTLPLSAGGLGLTSAQRSRGGAHWASWADCIRMVKERHPAIAEMMITHMGGGTAPCFQAVRECQQSLEDAGFNIPSWRELAESSQVREADPEPNQQVWVAAEGHSEVGATVRARGGVAWFGRSHEGSASFPTRSSGLSSIDSSAHVSGHTD